MSDRVVLEGVSVATARSRTEIVEQVSLSVRPGETLGLVGESGSGKTTLGLAMLAHARRGLRISGGRVVVDDRDILDLKKKELSALRGREMAYVPQDPTTALNPGLRIGTQLTEVMTAHGYSRDEARSRIVELLPEVGLADIPNLERSYPHQLSGGQQQRVGIAMAFACRPGVIVLDEPTTGLDVTTQRTVLTTVRELCARHGVAAIYVSHDLLVVNELAERVAVVYSGRIVEFGTTADVLRNPRHPYTRMLLRAVPRPEEAVRLVGIDGNQPRPGQRPHGCAFLERCPLRVPACERELPELYPAGPDGHVARCFRLDDSEEIAVADLSAGSHPHPVAAATEPMLEVSGLDAHYGPRQVLDDVSLVVPKLACVAVVGE
jgi:peptide/nickel transport system ATP-binding protein